MPGRRQGKAGEWGAGGALKAQRRPTAKVPGQLVPEALLFAVGPVWGRGAEQKGTLCSHPARAPARRRLRGIPPDLRLPLRLALPCLAPVLELRFPFIPDGAPSTHFTILFQPCIPVVNGGWRCPRKKEKKKQKKDEKEERKHKKCLMQSSSSYFVGVNIQDALKSPWSLAMHQWWFCVLGAPPSSAQPPGGKKRDM
ncbi:hypothetical protein AAY473_016907 [Plecturocebus cupreus]